MKLNPNNFNRHLRSIGQTMSMRRAYACPCVNPSSGAALPSCPVCKGKGRTWSSDAQEGPAGISGMKIQREWMQSGNAEMGDVVITVGSDSALYALGPFDRVIMLDSSKPFSMNYKRGSNDVMRFPAVSIERVFWIASNAIVEGGIPSVDADGVMTWASGAPPVGQTYSITGRQRPEYFIWSDYPQDRAHHQGRALPRRVLLRKFDLYGR